MNIDAKTIPGLKVTVMGLGLHGGGTASARFFAERGAYVTVTDLRDETILKPSIESLEGLNIRFVLGRHEAADFLNADIVIKNPAVPQGNRFLGMARQIETDISVFLSLSKNPILAVTGSKGKSTTASAMHWALLADFPEAKLGGNITVSPLTFLEVTDSRAPVVLELSSWQLADMKGKGILKPKVSVITSIFPDHQDRYGSMEAYVADKRLIYRDQDRDDCSVFNYDDPYGRSFGLESPAHVLYFSRFLLPAQVEGAYLEGTGKGLFRSGGSVEELLSEDLCVKGFHQRANLLAAGTALKSFGIKSHIIRERLASFPGVEHRLEFLCKKRGVSFYNDSAATIPEALVAAVESFTTPLLLITGGTDKNLDFTVFSGSATIPKAIFLLSGTATDKLTELLAKQHIPYRGPYADLSRAVRDAASSAEPGDSVLLSPGCASFGMFLNEFDRGRKFKELVASLPD